MGVQAPENIVPCPPLGMPLGTTVAVPAVLVGKQGGNSS